MEYSKTIDGEPEITLTIRDTNDYIKIWIGYFDALMQYGTPQEGVWDGFLRHYHLHDGFYDAPNWVIPSLSSYLKSIENIEVPANEFETIEIKQKMIALFNRALDKKLDVIINYE